MTVAECRIRVVIAFEAFSSVIGVSVTPDSFQLWALTTLGARESGDPRGLPNGPDGDISWKTGRPYMLRHFLKQISRPTAAERVAMPFIRPDLDTCVRLGNGQAKMLATPEGDSDEVLYDMLYSLRGDSENHEDGSSIEIMFRGKPLTIMAERLDSVDEVNMAIKTQTSDFGFNQADYFLAYNGTVAADLLAKSALIQFVGLGDPPIGPDDNFVLANSVTFIVEMKSCLSRSSRLKKDFNHCYNSYTYLHGAPMISVVFQWVQNGNITEKATNKFLQPPLTMVVHGAGRNGACWHVYTFLPNAFRDFWKRNTRLEDGRSGNWRSKLLKRLSRDGENVKW
jgi:hypothetical protein